MNTLRYALLTGLLAALGCQASSTPPPIIVGHVADKTRLDKAGEHAEQGIRLALNELTKDAKFVEAMATRSIQVRHTDTRGKLEAYEAEAVRLVSVNRAVGLLGGQTVKESSALDQAQVPVLAFHGHKAPGSSKQQVFYLGMSPTAQGEALAKFVAEDAKIKRIAVLTNESRPESIVVTEAFQAALKTARKEDEVVFVPVRFRTDSDWADIATRVDADADAIFFAGASAEFNAWQKQYRQSPERPAPRFIFAGEDDGQRGFDVSADKTSVIVATAFMVVPAIDKTQTFAKAYQDAFQTSADLHAALAYDGMRLLADAIKRAQPQPSADRVREELAKTKDFDGVTGTLQIGADRVAQRPLFVARWERGALTYLKTVPPTEKKD